MTVKHLWHNRTIWQIVLIEGSYFARCGRSDTGPYSTAEQAEEFIKAIRP